LFDPATLEALRVHQARLEHINSEISRSQLSNPPAILDASVPQARRAELVRIRDEHTRGFAQLKPELLQAVSKYCQFVRSLRDANEPKQRN
jgi:hypothetical protein